MKKCSVTKSSSEKQAWKSHELNSLVFWFKESTILQKYKQSTENVQRIFLLHKWIFNFEQLQILSSIECRKKLHPTTSHFCSKIVLCSAQSALERDNFIIAFVYAMIFIFLSITALHGIYPHLICWRKKRCCNSCVRQGISCFQRSVMISVTYLFENSPSENPFFSRYREYCLVYDKCLTWHSLKTLFLRNDCSV